MRQHLWIMCFIIIGIGMLACEREAPKGGAPRAETPQAGVSPSPPAIVIPYTPEEAHRVISKVRFDSDRDRQLLHERGGELVPYLREDLRSPDEKVRRIATDMMTLIPPQGIKEAVPELIAVAANPREQPMTRNWAIQALGKSQDPRALPVLGNMLWDKNRDVQWEAWMIFDGNPFPGQCQEVDEYLLKAMNDPQSDQYTAARLLAARWGYMPIPGQDYRPSKEERLKDIKRVRKFWTDYRSALEARNCGERFVEPKEPTKPTPSIPK